MTAVAVIALYIVVSIGVALSLGRLSGSVRKRYAPPPKNLDSPLLNLANAVRSASEPLSPGVLSSTGQFPPVEDSTRVEAKTGNR
jgi:hypothetical protein